MPIYEYRCTECHQVFEEWCKHVEDGNGPRSCPICKGQSKRLISHTSFALKGGGWYATEYGTHKNRTDNGGTGTTPTGTESASPGPTEDQKAVAPAMAAGG